MRMHKVPQKHAIHCRVPHVSDLRQSRDYLYILLGKLERPKLEMSTAPGAFKAEVQGRLMKYGYGSRLNHELCTVSFIQSLNRVEQSSSGADLLRHP